MGRAVAETQNNAAATRGQVVQRVLVDGWDAAQAAAAFKVNERDVVRLVTAYRRYGMASLRDDAAVRPAPWRWFRWLGLAMRRITTGRGAARPPAQLAPLVLSRHRGVRRRRR